MKLDSKHVAAVLAAVALLPSARAVVAQESGATHRVQQIARHLYAGVVTGGDLRVEDSNGNRLRKVDYDPAPFVGATFVGRF
jgi:hypothetical protein